MKKIKVVELFAGVGGFRIGLEKASSNYKVVWMNQWEPGKKNQYAFDCYISHFGSKNCINKDIAEVKEFVPEHDLLVGGFPCQDYSVAATGAQGIEGKKGVLWWEIRDIVAQCKPRFIFLENVDRLIISPSKQRGRDFAIMLKCLDDLGYYVEWRVINAAEYGHVQKRRRTYIVGFRKKLNVSKVYRKCTYENIVHFNGLFAKGFPIQDKVTEKETYDISKITLTDISNTFQERFYNSGLLIDGIIYTEKTSPIFVEPRKLGEIIQKESVNEEYFLLKDTNNYNKFEFLKGKKRLERQKPNGDIYHYAEGAIPFPDKLDSPARTMLTSEGTINRSSHVVCDYISNELRILTPIECERINEFPDNWTNTGMTERFRYFTMGNALVCGIVEKIGKQLKKIIDEEKDSVENG